MHNPPKAIVLWSEDSSRLSLFRILAATGAQVVTTAHNDVEARASENDVSLVLIDLDYVERYAVETLSRLDELPGKPPVLIVTRRAPRRLFEDEALPRSLTNLFVKNVDLRAPELIVTVQKLIRRDIFGLSKYLFWGAETVVRELNHSDQRREIREEVGDSLRVLGANPRLRDQLVQATDEFLMNAIYNAPTGSHGEALFRELPRSTPVELGEKHKVVFEYGCDGMNFGISVSDRAGAIERERVLEYLKRCFVDEDQVSEESGGAGLGLYFSFTLMNHFIINTDPGKRTEMIGLMDISGNYRHFANQPKSWNFFHARS